MLTYAGIGSRETPQNILVEMHSLARHFASKGYQLRSGGAIGADRAFEAGAMIGLFDHNGPAPIIYTPGSDLNWAPLKALAHDFHPNWPAVLNKGDYVVKLMARNSAIILGEHLDSPVDFIVCWTPGGLPTGGTSQALRIADYYKIPVHNLFTHAYNIAEATWLPRQTHLPL